MNECRTHSYRYMIKMTRSCVAINCHTRQSSQSKADGISFHCIPRDEIRRKLWLQKIRRVNYKPKPYDSLCSTHFTQDCFTRPTSGTYKLLKKTAIPTIFDFPEHLKEKVKLVRRPLHRVVPMEDVPVEADDDNLALKEENKLKHRKLCMDHDHLYAISSDPTVLKRKHIYLQQKVEELYDQNRLLQVKVCKKKSQNFKTSRHIVAFKAERLIIC